MKLRLVQPTEKYFISYLTALEEHQNNSANPDHFQHEIDNFPGSITTLVARELSGTLPQRTYWLVDSSDYLGTIQIRRIPSGRYDNIKSQVYYDIRPSKRRLGFGTIAFNLIREKARRLGLNSLIISCDSDNLPSRKIIEKTGAQLTEAKIVPDRQAPVLIYKLQL